MKETKDLARRFTTNDTMQQELIPTDPLFDVRPLDISRGGTNGKGEVQPKALASLTQRKNDLRENLFERHEKALQQERIQAHLDAKAEADKADAQRDRADALRALRDRLIGAFKSHSGGYKYLPQSLQEAAMALPQPTETVSYRERFKEVAGDNFLDGVAGLLQFQTATHVRARQELDDEIANEATGRYAEHTSRNVKINDLRRELPEASFANLVNLVAPGVEEVKKTVEVYYRNARAGDISIFQETTEQVSSIREQSIRAGAELAKETERRIIATTITEATTERIGTSVRDKLKAIGKATAQSVSNETLHSVIKELNQTHPPVAIEVFKKSDVVPTELSGAGAFLAETIINSNPDTNNSNNK